MKKVYKAIDLFAGIGGIRLGFMQAFNEQIKFVYTNEIDSYASLTYEANFEENPQGDITKVIAKDMPDFDILVAGFPCQAFSIAGKKRGFNDTRGTLFFNIAQILKIKNPEVFLLENVKHLEHHDNGRTFQIIKDVLTEDLKYNIHTRVLNARNFGVPQNRERLFIIGFKNNLEFQFPKPLNIPVKIDNILEKTVEESFYLSHEYLTGLKKHRARHEAKGNGFGFEIKPRNGIANAIVCGGMGKERNLIKDVILTNCWKKEGDDIQLRNQEGIRKMTPKEWARLQGFPDSFIFPVSMTRTYKQLANSVAIPVVKAIAIEMRKSLEKNIILNKRILLKEEKEIISLLERMFEKKVITKTGKKFINSIEKFINQNYLRISNLNNLIRIMERYKIFKKINKNQIQITKKLLNIPSKDDFLRESFKLLKKTNKEIDILDFAGIDIKVK